MRKLWSLAVLLLAVSVSPASIAADPVTGLKRIGILYQDRLFVSQIETFRQGLAALGYAEGKNIAYDYRLATAADLEQAARDMVRSGVDLIVAPGTPAALAAKRGKPDRSDPVPFSRSGRRRTGREPGTSGRKRHRGRQSVVRAGY